mmetsp:Transcript_33658/g.89327  ORF Transcript_33658/g.89327 Transcript_33658/m.89327 type:complete len:202 (-) Transcript_33658:34-639(-)
MRQGGGGAGAPLRRDAPHARHGLVAGHVLPAGPGVPRALSGDRAHQLPRGRPPGSPALHPQVRIGGHAGLPAALAGGRAGEAAMRAGGERRGAGLPPRRGVHDQGAHARAGTPRGPTRGQGTGRHRPRRHRHAAPRPSPEKLPRRGVQARLDPRPGDRFLHRGGERSVDPLQSRVAAGETVRAPGDAGQGLRLLLRGRGCQ